MRYKDLMELFDSRVPYQWTLESDVVWRARFSVGGYDYKAKFKSDHDTVFGPGWDFVFEIDLHRGSGKELSGVQSVGILNTGNAAQVFACVLRIVDEFITRKSPEYLAFSAEESNRKSLYRRMVNSLLVKYSAYKRVGDVSDDSLFIISRNPDHVEIRDNGI